MNLSRLIYISDATPHFSAGTLPQLVQAASSKNQAMGITGLLIFTGKHFLQVLEGDPLCVNSLYQKIKDDPRHENARSLSHKQVASRLFPEWGMQAIDANRTRVLDADELEKAVIRMRLSKGDSEADNALAMIQAFKRQFLAAA